jgi:hypothetical protein
MGCLIRAQGPENWFWCSKVKNEVGEVSFWRLGGGDVDIERDSVIFDRLQLESEIGDRRWVRRIPTTSLPNPDKCGLCG